LTLLLDGYGGHDSNILADQPGSGGSEFQNVPGQFGGGSAVLNYLWMRGQKVFNASASSGLREYIGVDLPLTHSHSASALFSFPLGPLQMTLRQDARYASFYQLAVLPHIDGALVHVPLPELVSPDTSLAEQATFGYDTAIEATHSLGTRNTVEYQYTRAHTEFREGGGQFSAQRADALFRRNLTRYATLRLGYGYHTASYTVSSAPTKIHNIDVGVDYGRPLSFSRRTRVGFSVGSSALERGDATIYRLQGNANIAHEIGRTWRVVGGYDRGAQFVEILPEPMYASTIGVMAGGLVGGRRLELRLNGSYSSGRLVLSSSGRGLVTYVAGGELQWAATRQVAVYGSYGFHHYEFGVNAAVPTELRRPISRHSIRIGARLWVPLFTQRGAADGRR
jgi:hypothetical protein